MSKVFGGALISPLHVLTVAHSFYYNQKKITHFMRLNVRVGSIKLNEGGKNYFVDDINTCDDDRLLGIGPCMICDIAVLTVNLVP